MARQRSAVMFMGVSSPQEAGQNCNVLQLTLNTIAAKGKPCGEERNRRMNHKPIGLAAASLPACGGRRLFF